MYFQWNIANEIVYPIPNYLDHLHLSAMRIIWINNFVVSLRGTFEMNVVIGLSSNPANMILIFIIFLFYVSNAILKTSIYYTCYFISRKFYIFGYFRKRNRLRRMIRMIMK